MGTQPRPRGCVYLRGPKVNYHASGLGAPLYADSLTSCGHADKLRLRKPRVLLAFLQILLTCVFPFKSLVIVTPRYLTFSKLSRTVSSKLQEALIFFPFPCNLHDIAFDWLESHALFPCPTAKTMYIIMKFHSVLCTFDFAISNTVVSKQSYLWVNICCDIVNIQWEQQWSKDGALGDTLQHGSPI